MKYLLPLIALCSCIQASASDTISKTTEISFANPYSSYTTNLNLPSTKLPTQSVPVDISNTLSQIGKVGQLSFAVNQNSLHSVSGDFSFVDELKITLTPDAQNSSGLTELIVIDFIPTSDQKSSADVDVPVLTDGNTLLQYFSSGGLNMNFTFTVSGHPPDSIDVKNTITADVSIAVNKSINDIGK